MYQSTFCAQIYRPIYRNGFNKTDLVVCLRRCTSMKLLTFHRKTCRKLRSCLQTGLCRHPSSCTHCFPKQNNFLLKRTCSRIFLDTNLGLSLLQSLYKRLFGPISISCTKMFFHELTSSPNNRTAVISGTIACWPRKKEKKGLTLCFVKWAAEMYLHMRVSSESSYVGTTDLYSSSSNCFMFSRQMSLC